MLWPCRAKLSVNSAELLDEGRVYLYFATLHMTRSGSFHPHFMASISVALRPLAWRASDKRARVAWTISVRIPMSSSLVIAAISAFLLLLACNSSILLATNSWRRSMSRDSERSFS